MSRSINTGTFKTFSELPRYLMIFIEIHRTSEKYELPSNFPELQQASVTYVEFPKNSANYKLLIKSVCFHIFSELFKTPTNFPEEQVVLQKFGNISGKVVRELIIMVLNRDSSLVLFRSVSRVLW